MLTGLERWREVVVLNAGFISGLVAVFTAAQFCPAFFLFPAQAVPSQPQAEGDLWRER